MIDTAAPIRLDVGCGDFKRAGFVGVDPYFPTDIEASAWDMPFDDGSVAEVYCSHALEHMTHNQAVKALQEFWRVLQPGGELTVIVPNARYVLQYALDHPGESWADEMIYGQRKREGDAHQSAWDGETLAAAVRAAGFEGGHPRRVWTVLQNQESLVMDATKPTGAAA